MVEGGGQNHASVRAPAVFISYASEDAAAAARVCEALRAVAIEVWFDQSELRGGDAWDQKIRREIRDCALFIPVISANTAARHEGYFRLEWDLADQRSHMIARNKAFIVPVCLDRTPESGADVPESFQRVQWTRLPDGNTPPAFTARVVALIGAAITASASISGPVAALPTGLVAAAKWTPRRSVAVVALIFAVATALVYVGVDRLWLAKRVPAGRPTAEVASAPEPATPTISEKSVAVLPFVDMSEKRDQEYFSDGLAEELTDRLAKVPDLRVPARTSSFYFKGKQATIAEIARMLGVAHVLEGSVRKSGNAIRITAQLIRADNGYHVWSETFDRPLTDVFKVQGEIAAAVVKMLKVSLLGAATSTAAMTTNTDAYALYLQARALERSAGEGDYAAAVGTLQRAVALDPKFATAWAELVFALVDDLSWHGDGDTSPQVCARVREAADRALVLAPALSEGHRAKGAALASCEHSYAAAATEYKRALELDPQNAAAWTAYSWAMLRANRLDDAIRYARGAVSRDPLNAQNYFPLADAQGYAGRFAEAEATYRKAIEMTPKPTPAGWHALHANSLLALNEPAAALKENALEGDDQFRQMNLPLVYDALGRKADAEREIAVFERKYSARDPLTMAEFYACREDTEHALRWLASFSSAPGPIDDVPNRIACFRKIEGDPRYQAQVLKWKQNAKPRS